MTIENAHGVLDGIQSIHPEWIRVSDRLPTDDGIYYTIAEAQVDLPICKKGTISVSTDDSWEDGHWWQNDDIWKVLYWAKPFTLAIPAELANRQQLI